MRRGIFGFGIISIAFCGIILCGSMDAYSADEKLANREADVAKLRKDIETRKNEILQNPEIVSLKKGVAASPSMRISSL